MGQSVLLTLLVSALVCWECMSSNGHGNRALDRVERAIGGQRVARGEWPGLVLLRATIVTRRLFGIIPLSHSHLFCGGALISDRWILSAAHCFMDSGYHATRAGNWEARLATVRLRAGVRGWLLDALGQIFMQNDMRQWEIDVERIVSHPGYNSSGQFTNDIALIKLSRSVPTNHHHPLIRAIPLPSANDSSFPSPGASCMTSGWGCTSRGAGPSQYARQMTMPIYSPWRCRYSYNLNTMDKRICAGHWNNSIGVCQGDSGSPLMCRRRNQLTLAGLVSFTSRDNPESFPAVFTRVGDYLPWIQSTMRTY